MEFAEVSQATECGELLLLRLADALRRIENHHANSRHLQETVRDGAAGVSGSRHEHGKKPRFAANEISHQPRHEARTEILKRQRWSVKQLQDVQTGRERNHLHGKIDRFAHNLPKHFFRNVGSGKRARHAKTPLREWKLAEFFQFLR